MFSTTVSICLLSVSSVVTADCRARLCCGHSPLRKRCARGPSHAFGLHSWLPITSSCLICALISPDSMACILVAACLAASVASTLCAITLLLLRCVHYLEAVHRAAIRRRRP